MNNEFFKIDYMHTATSLFVFAIFLSSAQAAAHMLSPEKVSERNRG